MKFSGRFKPNKWKWYLIDLTNWHRPIIVKKHLDSYRQARDYRDRVFNKNFTVASGREALKLDIKNFINYTRCHSLIRVTSKYIYPPWVKTRNQKKVYRTQLGNRRRSGRKRVMASKTAVWDIIDNKPMKFIKRLTLYNNNHYPYSQPVAGVWGWKKRYFEIGEIRLLCNIVRVLQKYYDLGDYQVEEVAEIAYGIWGAKIRKWCTGFNTNPTDLKQIEKEYIARGFIPLSETEFDEKTDNFVETLYIQPPLVYPKLAWHKHSEKGIYKHNIYDLQKAKGIPGFCRASVAGLKARK